MAIFTDADLAQLGDLASSLVLKDDGTILRLAQTQDPSGGEVDTWQAVATVKCAILDAGGPAEQIIATQQVGSIVKTALLARGTDVLKADRLQVGTVLYHIIDVFEPSTYEVLRRVLIRRLSIPLPQ